ncbi:L-ascorbate metabolism protein UlaG (beta-lactamase superfamily) [Nocardia tenerifensis]|uniref:L-ascorbate metabolism protein UlaG (Beta-lactamase superfamily) n=1 Tax=Nocardia tenerifensis TaxID=228006 RepID=A0A318KB00_9NOCA|nr:MBL fold metallo-hydrolase [Nocardia tenerifensis]PXX71528.1 L-ascorbate metabolism protein UlaG (beta-lactamase superfamily) [Nocardia tenerifensis]
MKVTHFGHACVLVDLVTDAGPRRVLFDPGTYSRDFERVSGIDIVLVTHAHPDHLDVDRLGGVLDANPSAAVVHGAGAVSALADYGDRARLVRPGEAVRVNDVEVRVTGGEHACVHADLPASDNNGYLLGGAVFHPGDAFDSPPAPVDVLLIPAAGPWMKIADGIDYLRAVAPRIAIPIHQAGLAEVHQRMHHRLLTELAPPATTVRVLEHAVPQSF